MKEFKVRIWEKTWQNQTSEQNKFEFYLNNELVDYDSFCNAFNNEGILLAGRNFKIEDKFKKAEPSEVKIKKDYDWVSTTKLGEIYGLSYEGMKLRLVEIGLWGTRDQDIGKWVELVDGKKCFMWNKGNVKWIMDCKK